MCYVDIDSDYNFVIVKICIKMRKVMVGFSNSMGLMLLSLKIWVLE